MKKAAVILLALVLSASVFAQGKFGADSAECIKYLSYYSEYMKQNNIAEATPMWRKAIRRTLLSLPARIGILSTPARGSK